MTAWMWLLINLLALLAAISPGPDFAVVSKNTISCSRRSGFLTAMGIGLAIFIHVSYCVLGIAVIISKSVVIFNTIKYMGSAYLIYIGIKGLLDKQDKKKNLIGNDSSDKSDYKAATLAYSLTRFQALRQGFLTCMFNPKATLFFLSLFAIIIKSSHHLSLLGKIILPFDISLITFAWFVILAIILSHKRVKKVLERAQGVIVKILSGFLVLLGVGFLFV